MLKKISINGTVYIPMDVFELPFKRGISATEAFEKYGVLHYGIKEVKTKTFFRRGYTVITKLVPEKNYAEFHKAMLTYKEKKEPSFGFLWDLIKGAVILELLIKDFDKSVRKSFSKNQREKGEREK